MFDHKSHDSVLGWLSTCYINANSNESHNMRHLSILRYPVILLAILCASCGTALPTVKPYKLDVQQGNVVTSKMLLQLRPGMTKSQVRFIMGTPLIQDSFHGNRWDYVYQLREGGKITEQRRVILDFENELLKTVRGDVVPSGSEGNQASGAENTGARVINPSAKPAEKSFFSKLKFWEKDEADLAKEAAAAKAKAEADEAAKENAVKKKVINKSLIKDSAAPAVESQSILAVPLEVLPALEAPAVAVPTPETPAAPLAKVKADPPAVIKEKAVVLTQPEPKAVVKAPVQLPVVVTPAEKATIPASTDPVTHDTSSGMTFDRTLTEVSKAEASKNAEPKDKPQIVEPRAGNKSVPKPKDLPADSAPSFFDRMLEKIGF